jgi:hypothetical protein
MYYSMNPLFLIADITVNIRLAKVGTLVGRPWLQITLIYVPYGILHATHLGSPSHPALPLPLVDQGALPEETAPPPQVFCEGCQTPIDTDGRLRRKIIHSHLKPQF